MDQTAITIVAYAFSLRTRIDQIGPPAEGVRFIDIGYRGADNFEVDILLLAGRNAPVSIKLTQLASRLVTNAI